MVNTRSTGESRMEQEILTYIKGARPSEMDLQLWIVKTFCLSYQESVKVVEGLTDSKKIRFEICVMN